MNLIIFCICSLTVCGQGQDSFRFLIATDGNFDAYDLACKNPNKTALLEIKQISTDIGERKRLSTQFISGNYSEIQDSCLVFFFNLRRNCFELSQIQGNPKLPTRISSFRCNAFLDNNNSINDNVVDSITIALLNWQLNNIEAFIQARFPSRLVQAEINLLTLIATNTNSQSLEYLLGLLYKKKENQTEAFKHYLKAGDKGKETIQRNIYNWKIEVDSLSLDNGEFKQYYGYMTSSDTIIGNQIKAFVRQSRTPDDVMSDSKIKDLFHDSASQTFTLTKNINSWVFFGHFKKLSTITITTFDSIDKVIVENSEEEKIIRPIRIIFKCATSTKELKKRETFISNLKYNCK